MGQKALRGIRASESMLEVLEWWARLCSGSPTGTGCIPVNRELRRLHRRAFTQLEGRISRVGESRATISFAGLALGIYG